jgi:hypothetical protein
LRTRIERLKQKLAGLLRQWSESLAGPSPPTLPQRWPSLAAPNGPLQPLQKVFLHDGVRNTLFREYQDHRQTPRGEEETGWLILGLRDEMTATILATLPAGAMRDAGESHVQFNTEAQAVAMRLLFPREKRLKLLGVVHTHPGTLRHPSRGDYQGDREWIKQLPGEQGLFGIGTVTDDSSSESPDHVQVQEGLRFDWYSLARSEHRYKPCPIEVVAGIDLAADLRPVWSLLEEHAVVLDRVARQLAKVRLMVISEPDPALGILIGLPDANQSLQVICQANHRQFIYEVNGAAFRPDLPADVPLEQAIYRFLQELAVRNHESNSSG